MKSILAGLVLAAILAVGMWELYWFVLTAATEGMANWLLPGGAALAPYLFGR
jgi:hypothetical protein